MTLDTMSDAALAEGLAEKYDSLEKINGEIKDKVFELKNMPVFDTPQKYSTFRFFWPFLIIAAVVCFAVTFFTSFITSGSSGYLVAKIIGYATIPVILLIGLFIAKALKKSANEEIEAKERTQSRKYNDLIKKIDELKVRQNTLEEQLSDYNNLIPMSLRNRTQMLRVKTILETGRAETLEEAIELIRKTGKA